MAFGAVGFVSAALLFVAIAKDSRSASDHRSWSVLLEACPDAQTRLIRRGVERFLDGANATGRLALVACNNPVAMDLAVQSSSSTGVSHFVIVATSATLDLLSGRTFPSGATSALFASNDFLFLRRWNATNDVSRLLRSVFVRWMWKYVYYYVDPYYEKSLHSNVHRAEEDAGPFVVEQLNFVENSPPEEFLGNLRRSDVRHVRSVAVAADADVTTEVVRLASAKGLLSSEHQWIVFYNGNLSALFDVLDLRANSVFYVIRHKALTDVLIDYLEFQQESVSGDAALAPEDVMGVDIVRLFLNEEGSISFRVAARWDPLVGLVSVSSSRYPDYQKRALRVVTSECPPYVIVQKDAASDTPHYSGYLVDVLMVVASLLNFTIDYVPADDAASAAALNSTWNGVVEALVRKRADVGLYDLTISPDRLRLIDFAQVAVDTHFTAGLFRRPGSAGNDKFGVYLEPFDLHVWIASIVTVFVLVASLYFSAFVTKKLGGEKAEKWDNDEVDVSRTILLGFQAVAQQGCELNFGNPSTRIIFVVLWIFALICYASYSATLMSYLTISKIELPFTSLSTLAQNKDYKIGFLDASSHLEMFRDSSSPVYHSVWKRILQTRFTTVVNDYAEGLSRVQNEKFVLLSDDKTMQYVTRNTCDLVVSEPLTSSQFVALGFQKDSEHQEAFSRALRYMNDAGILPRLRDKWWGTAVFCEQDTRVFVSLSLTNVATAFLLLVAGIFFGSLALVVEGVLRRCGCVAKQEASGKTVRLKINRSVHDRPRLRLHF